MKSKILPPASLPRAVFSTGDSLAPRGHWAMSGGILIVILGVGMLLRAFSRRVQSCCKTAFNAQEAPTTRNHPAQSVIGASIEGPWPGGTTTSHVSHILPESLKYMCIFFHFFYFDFFYSDGLFFPLDNVLVIFS